MENQFTEIMSSKTDQELVRIATILREDYQSDAVMAVDKEIERRKLDINNIEPVSEEVESIVREIETPDIEEETIDNLVVNSLIRLVHLFIDTIVIMFFLAIIVSVIDMLFPYPNGIFRGISGMMLFFLSYIGYYVFMEYNFQKTVAKFITQTRVIMLDEQDPNLIDIIKRSLFRLIPIDKISYIFTKRGFHDYLSNTVIVRDRN